MSNRTALFAVVLVAALGLSLAPAAQATEYTWSQASGALNWGDAANWTPNTGFPDAAADRATFGTAITGATTVNLGGNRTVGTLTFSNAAQTYQIEALITSLNYLLINDGTGGGTIANTGAATNRILSKVRAGDGTGTLTVNATAGTLEIQQTIEAADLIIEARVSNVSGGCRLSRENGAIQPLSPLHCFCEWL